MFVFFVLVIDCCCNCRLVWLIRKKFISMMSIKLRMSRVRLFGKGKWMWMLFVISLWI